MFILLVVSVATMENMFSDDGKVISNDCNSCHIIISQTMKDGTVKTSLDGLEFKHPVDMGETLKQHLCTDCHWTQD